MTSMYGRALRAAWLALVLGMATSAASAATAASAPTAAAPALPGGITRVTTVEGISEYRLPNGLRVLLFPDASKQTITVNVTYLVGSRQESYGETGMAHLLEHMVFKGSTKHPNIPQELTEHGARPNGSTSYDRTNYFETFAASDDNLRWALDLEADRMVNSFIAKKDLDSEMTVVRNEFESGENDPGRVLVERVLATAYLWHNYGHTAIGSPCSSLSTRTSLSRRALTAHVPNSPRTSANWPPTSTTTSTVSLGRRWSANTLWPLTTGSPGAKSVTAPASP